MFVFCVFGFGFFGGFFKCCKEISFSPFSSDQITRNPRFEGSKITNDSVIVLCHTSTPWHN